VDGKAKNTTCGKELKIACPLLIKRKFCCCNCASFVSLFDELSMFVDRELNVDIVYLLGAHAQFVVECRTLQSEQTQGYAYWKQQYLAFQTLATQYFLYTKRNPYNAFCCL